MNLVRYVMVLMVLFAMRLIAKEPDPIWGKPKESAVVGFWHNAHMPGNGTIAIYVCQVTNYMKNLVRPATDYQAIKFMLIGTNNRPVALSDEGKKYGQKLQTMETRAMKASHHLRNPSRFCNR